MFYKSYAPSACLSSLIARYMIIIDDTGYSTWQVKDVMPVGVSGLGFSFGEDFRYLAGDREGSRITQSNVIGIHNRPYAASWKGSLQLLVVIFKPVGLFHFLNRDMSELKNALTGFDLLGITESEQICETLRGLPEHDQKISFIESWIKKKLAGKSPARDITTHIAEEIVRRRGMISIREMARELNINRRFIERNFSLKLGLSPKEFAEIARFNFLNSLMLQRERFCWQELAYIGNFHDQSHLIKHFRKVTGLPPNKYCLRHRHNDTAKFIDRHNVVSLMSTASHIRSPGQRAETAIIDMQKIA